MSDFEPEWAYPHDNDVPCDNRSVAVLIAHKDGTYSAGIGRYYGKNGWSVIGFEGARVVGWHDIAPFADATEVVEHQ